MQRLTLRVIDAAEMALAVQNTDGALSFTIDKAPGTEYPTYHGETTVTPMVSEQTLETANHLMRDDVTVRAIPYQTTSNPSGGYTAIIGG